MCIYIYMYCMSDIIYEYTCIYHRKREKGDDRTYVYIYIQVYIYIYIYM